MASGPARPDTTPTAVSEPKRGPGRKTLRANASRHFLRRPRPPEERESSRPHPPSPAPPYNLLGEEEFATQRFDHPFIYQLSTYTLGFVLVFRVNLSFNRFWEARTQIEAMSS